MDIDVAVQARAANLPTEDLPDTTFERLFNPGFQVRTSGHNLTLAWDVSDSTTLKSITSYREVSRTGGNSLGTSLVAGGSSKGFLYTWAFEKIGQDQTSQEFQFIGSWDQFDLTGGAIWFNEQVTDFRRSNVTGPALAPGALGLQPAALQYCIDFGLDPCPTTNALQEAESDSYGVYAQGNYRPEFAPGLELTLGVRYTDDTKDARRTQSNSAARRPARGFQRLARRPGGVDQVPVDRRHPDVPALRHRLSCGRRQRAFHRTSRASTRRRTRPGNSA